MSNRFARRDDALSECDICGFRFKLRLLKELIVKNVPTQIMACPECWNPSHPQLKLGTFPVQDPQAIRNPRPDFTGYPQSRSQVVPLFGQQLAVNIGTVTVVIS
jgi:hypothetical protein